MVQLDIQHCKKPWSWTYIHVNGDVKPCCYARGSFGNVVRSGSLRPIIGGPMVEELKAFVAANRIHPICSKASCAYVKERSARPEDFADASIWAAGNVGIPQSIPTDLGISDSIIESARSGNRHCVFRIGLACFQADRFDEAIEWFVAASQAGSEHGHMMLGRIYYSPLGNAVKDLDRARAHFLRAAEEGLGRAWTMLGHMALDGHGGDAAEYFRTAGDRGDPEGWYRLSELYRDGKTVEPDTREADRLLKLAANRGHAVAREMLGIQA